MRRFQDKLVRHSLTSFTVAVVFLLVLVIPVLAQQPGRGSVPPNRETVRARQRGQMDQELQLRGLVNERDVNQPDRQNQLRVMIEQTKQDFDRIQVLNTELARAAMANNGFDYKTLTEMVGEVKKRARRLKSNMQLPPPDKGKPSYTKLDEISQTKMSAALIMLINRIVSFVTNPLFEKPNWIDIKLGARASYDLEAIIDLSGTIRKNTERLSKTP